MRAEAVFERHWAEMADGVALDEIASRVPSLPLRVLEDLAAAAAVRRLADHMEPPDPEAGWIALRSRLDEEALPARVRTLGRRPWVARALVAAAAGMVALASVSMRALPGSPLYPLRRGLERTALILSPSDGGLHVRLADARLGDLLHALTEGPVGDGPGLARELLLERKAALAAGDDVSQLDLLIASRVSAALSGASPEVASEIRAILASLLPPPPSQGSEGDGGNPTAGGSSGGTTSEGSGGQDAGSSGGAVSQDGGSGAPTDESPGASSGGATDQGGSAGSDSTSSGSTDGGSTDGSSGTQQDPGGSGGADGSSSGDPGSTGSADTSGSNTPAD